MKLFPAIDLYRGQAVRLLRGDYDRMTVYSNDPVSVAKGFREAGAEYIHLVDLEGARDGGTPNFDTVAAIAAESGLKAEIGGGIRDMETAEKYLSAGVMRVILGTAAVENRDFLSSAVRTYGDRIAVGADVRNGLVAVKGWLKLTALRLEDFLADMEDMGVKTVICTDISKDGAMVGTNRELYRRLSERFSLDIVASGGVSTLEDVTALRDMGLYGAILGRAIYTGGIDLRRAVEVCR